jgi:hypothetical protein
MNFEISNALREHDIEPSHFNLGRQYLRCPQCAANARHAYNRRARKLALDINEDGAVLWICNNCGWAGGIRSGWEHRPIDPIALARARAAAAERKEADAADRVHRAQWLWAQSVSPEDTPTENYLRNRGYCEPIPATIRHLPSTDKYLPAMISAFGLASEPEPGVIAIAACDIHGVHLTKLEHDGSGKADIEPNKMTFGLCSGSPIVLAPPNDQLGLAVAEGIEDALSVYAATGLGAWAAGSGPFMPELANIVPDYINCVTIAVDDDEVGHRYASELRRRLEARGIEAEYCLGGQGSAAS